MIWLGIIIGFIIGRLSKTNIYIGFDEGRYRKCEIGILLRKK